MKQKSHSRLSASGSHQWLACPGSIKLSEKAPPKPTHPSAQIGTVAHSILEMAIQMKLGRSEVDPNTLLGTEIGGILVDRSMLRGAKIAFDYIFNLYQEGDELLLEQRVTLEHIHPDMFGTADVILIKKTELHIIDYKFGFYPVDPKNNSQLIYYALGVTKTHDYKDVTLHIVQPNSRNGIITDSWKLDDQNKWIEKFTKAANAADIGTPIVKGKHCAFCQAKPICGLHSKSKESSISP